jgi:hypothetical protein
MLNVVLISKYCEASGDTKKAVESRIQRGAWVEGIHFYKVEGMRERWVNLDEIIEWVKKQGSCI